MLRTRQVVILIGVALALWVVATLSIRWSGRGMTDPLRGGIIFVTTVPIGWLSVRLVRWTAGLSKDQLLAGVMLSGAMAMLIDGLALRWAPQVYGAGDPVVRSGSAWLLWGYGVSFAFAFFMRRPSVAQPQGRASPN